MKTVTIIIANWNGADMLMRCLVSLAAQTFHDFEVIVVDNGSTDDSLSNLSASFSTSNLRVERLATNRGFAAANNIGARLARGEWLAMLNQDAFPAPDWLEHLVGAATHHPEFAFFASRLIQADDHTRLDGAGDVYHVSGLSCRRDHNRSAEQCGLSSGEVFSACGAAAMYSRESFLNVGGFDEDLFSYNEDVDLGFRLRLLGERCLYVADAVVHHIGSATLGKRSDFAIYHGHRNLVWVYWKNMPARLFWLYLPLHILMNILYVIYFSFSGHARAIWRAKIDAVRGLGVALNKRRAIQKTRSVTVSELARVMDRRWFSPLVRSR